MAGPERRPHLDEGQQFIKEDLSGDHFYAAYIFDQAGSRRPDIETVIAEAQRLGYPVRYWWLSEAMQLDDCPERLIVCVHHPANDVNAGMDLYEALKQKAARWDDYEAAALEEYAWLGKRITSQEGIFKRAGSSLFPKLQNL